MIARYLAVLSGIHARVAHKMGPDLRSRGIDVAFVDTDKLTGEVYFDQLLSRTMAVAAGILSRPDIRLRSLLVSCITDSSDLHFEFGRFFPAMRRLSLPSEFRKDVAVAGKISNRIASVFRSQEYEKISKAALPHKEPRLLLPVKNSRINRLENHYRDIYEFRVSELNRRVERDISRLKSGQGHNINGMYFKGCINDGTHPIRRCTDSILCDLQAMMRFGVHLPERFEFDVSCETGVAGKTFFLCDGSAQKIPSRASYLNMRVNDDFSIGTK